jgi:hypothetical protein
MKNNKTLAIFIGLIGLLNYSSNAYSALPELCFQTKLDVEIYYKFGFDTPPVYSPEDEYIFSKTPSGDYHKAIEYGKHGPAKRKAITIATKEITVNGKPYMDASESTTPSGKKSYFWQAATDRGIMDSTSKFPLTPAGAEYLFNLTVSDPVCEAKATKQLKLHIH